MGEGFLFNSTLRTNILRLCNGERRAERVHHRTLPVPDMEEHPVYPECRGLTLYCNIHSIHMSDANIHQMKARKCSDMLRKQIESRPTEPPLLLLLPPFCDAACNPLSKLYANNYAR